MFGKRLIIFLIVFYFLSSENINLIFISFDKKGDGIAMLFCVWYHFKIHDESHAVDPLSSFSSRNMTNRNKP